MSFSKEAREQLARSKGVEIMPTHRGEKLHTVRLTSDEVSTLEYALLMHSIEAGRLFGADSPIRVREIALRDKLLRLSGRRDLRA